MLLCKISNLVRKILRDGRVPKKTISGLTGWVTLTRFCWVMKAYMFQQLLKQTVWLSHLFLWKSPLFDSYFPWKFCVIGGQIFLFGGGASSEMKCVTQFSPWGPLRVYFSRDSVNCVTSFLILYRKTKWFEGWVSKNA